MWSKSTSEKGPAERTRRSKRTEINEEAAKIVSKEPQDTNGQFRQRYRQKGGKRKKRFRTRTESERIAMKSNERESGGSR